MSPSSAAPPSSGDPAGAPSPPPAGERIDLRRSWLGVTTSRPVAVLMVFLAVIVFGWFSAGLLPLNLMPDISYPKLTVRTEYPD